MKIKKLDIEGFRGINKPLSISFNDRLTVLYGDNGSGKSSVFQAIVWGIFGKLNLSGAFSGAEFQREDAIVNDFHPEEKATVVITLDSGLTITRTRSKKSKTGFLKSDSKVIATDGINQYKDQDAQDFIHNHLGINPEEINVSVHLAQETIRDFIEGDDSERSKTVDKMIGLLNLRELIAGIDLKTIDKEISDLEKQKELIERTLIQATLLAREMVAGQENELVAQGVNRDAMTLQNALDIFSQASGRINELADSLGIVVSISPISSLSAGKNAVSEAKSGVSEIHEARISRNNTINLRINRLNSLKNDLLRAESDLEAIAGIDPKELKEKRSALSTEQQTERQKLQSINYQASEFRQIHSKISDLLTNIETTRANLEALDSAEAAKQKIKNLNDQMHTIDEMDKSLSVLKNLLPLAKDYLIKDKPEQCPVCQEAITDLSSTIAHLDHQIELDEETRRIESLRIEMVDMRQKKRDLEQLVNSIDETETKLVRYQSEVADVSQRVEGFPDEASPEEIKSYINDRIQTLTDEASWLENRTSELGIEISTIEGQLRSLQQKQDVLGNLKRTIKDELKISSETDDLKIQIDEAVQQNSLLVQELQGYGTVIGELTNQLDRVESLLRILEAKKSLAELEKNFPTANLQKEALQRAINELRELKLGLQDIYQSATEHLKNLVDEALEKLLPIMNEHFARILGHPEYSELQIIPEEEKKGVFRYWFGARSPGSMKSTFVTTRFSTAQRNAAAIAIFMSMAELLPHDFNTLMIDEPTQSMDPKRQKALAQFISEESGTKQIIVATEMPTFTEMLSQQDPQVSVYEFDSWAASGAKLLSKTIAA